MTPQTFIIAKDFPTKKLSKELQPDYVVINQADEKEDVLLLDTFDEELRNEDKILLETESELLLLDMTRGIILSQLGRAKFLCPPQLPSGDIKEALTQVSELRAFLPVSQVSLVKETKLILDDEGKTVVRLHCFGLGRKNKNVQVVISQPLRGYDEEYSRLIKALTPLAIETTTPFKTLGIKSSGYNPKPDLPLVIDAPIKQTTNEIISTFINVARQNEAGIERDHDTEFLHDYRVSFRKVRSVISLFKGVYSPEDTTFLKSEFADIMQVTGRLRDLDVYLLDKDNYFSLVPSTTHEGLEIMFSEFEKERSQNHRLICKSLKNKAYKKRVSNLTAVFLQDRLASGPLAETKSLTFGCKIILKRYNKVCKIARSIDQDTEDAIVHELRIHCKKLRYLMEFFTPLFPRKKIKSLIKSLKVLQDNLGRFNDYSVQQESLGVFLSDNPMKGEKGIKVAESIGALTAMLNLMQQKERSQVMENFAQFDSTETRELFHQLFRNQG